MSPIHINPISYYELFLNAFIILLLHTLVGNLIINLPPFSLFAAIIEKYVDVLGKITYRVFCSIIFLVMISYAILHFLPIMSLLYFAIFCLALVFNIYGWFNTYMHRKKSGHFFCGEVS
mgnify:CR=1 FL=1